MKLPLSISIEMGRCCWTRSSKIPSKASAEDIEMAWSLDGVEVALGRE